MADRVHPRPGSAIWKRVDGGFTGMKSQASGARHLEQFPHATAEERLAWEMQQPGGLWIYDGNDNDHPETEFAIERFSPKSLLLNDGCEVVVLAPRKPPFGEWVELDRWPEEGDD